MSLLKKYRATRELIGDRAITVSIWDMLVLLEIAERAPVLEAETRFLEFISINVDKTTSTYVSKVLQSIEAENKKMQEEDKSNGKEGDRVPDGGSNGKEKENVSS